MECAYSVLPRTRMDTNVFMFIEIFRMLIKKLQGQIVRSRKVEDFLKYSVLCEKLGGVCVHSFCKNYLWYSVCQNDLDYSFPCVDFFHESNVYNQGVETIFLTP